MATWQFQEAKTHLSELIDRALAEGPQTITRHGAECAVVLSMKDYHALQAFKPSIMDVLLNAPQGDELDIPRDKDVGRPVDL